MSGKPRVTVEIDTLEDGTPCTVEVYLNPEGVEHLIEELRALSESHDHFHWFTPEWNGPGGELSSTPYREGRTTASHLKVNFRPDHWDEEFYPHVLDENDHDES